MLRYRQSSLSSTWLWILCIGLLSLCARATINDGPPSNGTSFDYIIVGAGTSGLVLANRLSSDPEISVAVLEPGSSQIDNPNVTMLGHFGLGLHTDIDWQYESAPQVFANGKPQVYDQGKGLGGTSLINGMTYVRAATSQIDAWESSFGNSGWNWATLSPYYLKSETFQTPNANQTKAGCSYNTSVHGDAGPVEVGWFEGIAPPTTYHKVRSAWEATGSEWILDPNTGNASGASPWPLTVSRSQNIRWDAAQAYLYPSAIARRTNLQVYQHSTAQRLLWADDENGQAIARGVDVTSVDGQSVSIAAGREVILSAGAIKSPVLLEASGVGNANVLSAQNISVKLDLPSVGFNFQDQPNTGIGNAAGTGLNFTAYPTYVTFSTAVDLFGDNTTQVENYVRSQIPAYAQAIVGRAARNATTTETQEKLLSDQADLIFKDLIPVAELLTAPFGAAVAVPFWVLLPFSRGSVHINGSSVDNTPIIDPNFFMVDWDNIAQSAAARQTRRFLANGQAAGWVGVETTPGRGNVSTDATDEEWFSYFKESYAPNYHPCGSAAMMARELGGVVDAELVVYGTKNVRVVDASVLPAQVDGHLTSTLYAVAERAADVILGHSNEK